MGGMVGAASDTISFSPSMLVPSNSRARWAGSLGAKVSTPDLGWRNLQLSRYRPSAEKATSRKNVSGVGRAVTRRASNQKVWGSTLGLDEIFVRCFQYLPPTLSLRKRKKKPVCDA